MSKVSVADEVRELVAERERGGRFRDLGELAARAATRRGTLEQLAWAGACDGLVDVGRGRIIDRPLDGRCGCVRRG